MEKRNLINGYYLLQQDLIEIFSFIEPSKDNYQTYSHRLYALLVRACMEFEAGCRMILIEKEFALPPMPNIRDYWNIHNYDEYKLINDYCIKLEMSEEIELDPLKRWDEKGNIGWYQEYNKVKHSRVINFSKANLLNVICAIGSVYILLFARYGYLVFNQFQEPDGYNIEDGYYFKADSLFRVKPPDSD